MEIIDLFKQPVARVILNEDLDLLLKFCLKVKKENKGRKKSNIGGFQSNDIKLNSPEIRNLCNTITIHSNMFLKEIFKINQDVLLFDLWININNYK